MTEQSAVRNLRSEGIARNRIHLVGNTMVDTLLCHRDRAEQSAILQRLGLAGSDSDNQATLPYGVVTLHRPGNVDDPAAFRNILDALLTIGKTLPLVFPVHPRTVARIQEFGLAEPMPHAGHRTRQFQIPMQVCIASSRWAIWIF